MRLFDFTCLPLRDASAAAAAAVFPHGQDVSAFPVEKIVYVMTDFTESNFKFWAEHPVSAATFGGIYIRKWFFAFPPLGPASPKLLKWQDKTH